MRWESLPTNESGIIEFRLTDNDVLKVRLKYNALQHSVRVIANDARRLFFLEQHPGILKSKTVFTNEYGLEVGKLCGDKWNSNHYILKFEGKRFKVSFTNHPLPAVTIFKKNNYEPLLNCAFPIHESGTVLNITGGDNDKASALFLGLGWYLALPKNQESIQQYALTA